MEKMNGHITNNVAELLKAELDHARRKHKEFPNHIGGAISIILEELGEVAKDFNDGAQISHLLEEVAQTAVTCIRFLESHSSEIRVKPKGVSFLNDADKVNDMFTLSKEEFLDSYSYLTEDDYNTTIAEIREVLNIQSEEEDNEF